MALVGYARVSSKDQDLSIQLTQLTQAGCARIFSEKKTGTNTERPELDACMNYLRPGDTLMITRLDRLARSMTDFFHLIERLTKNDVKLKILLQPELNIDTVQNRLMLAFMAALAEIETDLRKQRQREGIDAAKARGVYNAIAAKDAARNARLSMASKMLNQGASMIEVHRDTGVPLKTLYRRFPGRSRLSPKRSTVPVTAPSPAPPSAAEAVVEYDTPETVAHKLRFLDRFRRAQ